MAYLEGDGRMSVLQSLDKLSVAQRGEAARQFGRAAVDQLTWASTPRVSRT